MKKLTLLTLPLAALALAACGQKTTTPPGGQNLPASKPYTKYGEIWYFKSGGETIVIGSFHSISPIALPKAPDPNTLDTCQLGNIDAVLGTFISPGTTTPGTALDAGAALTFKKNGVAIANLPRTEVKPQAAGPEYQYIAQNLVLNGLSNLTLSIPGAAGGFPAFTDVPFLVPNSAFSVKIPADLKSVTPTTSFTWTGASNDPNAAVLIVAQQSKTQSFFCTARDDGSFSIPSDFQDVLKAQNFTKGGAFLIQDLTQFKTSGDALLVLRSISSVGL